MHRLEVDLGTRSYPIQIQRDGDGALLQDLLRGREAVCLVDANVVELHAERLERLLPGLARLSVPSGEASKRLSLLGELAESCLDLGLGRDGLIVAVGGGVTGDLAGFLAASYMRGIPFIQVPSTLLAQIDASVGGKVAVNLPGAKNSLGFFHQPEAVYIDLAFLETLPRREMRAGTVEAIKMAACLDAGFLSRCAGWGADLLDPRFEHMSEFVARCCELKSEVVRRDEREAGLRQVLNFGHTLAHAIEGHPSRPDFLHGEAVALGMLFALELGEAEGLSRAGLSVEMREILAKLGLPLTIPADLPAEELHALMGRDKKKKSGRPRFVLLRDWEMPRLDVDLSDGAILRGIHALSDASAQD